MLETEKYILAKKNYSSKKCEKLKIFLGTQKFFLAMFVKKFLLILTRPILNCIQILKDDFYMKFFSGIIK